jgi:hypothetical protein
LGGVGFLLDFDEEAVLVGVDELAGLVEAGVGDVRGGLDCYDVQEGALGVAFVHGLVIIMS